MSWIHDALPGSRPRKYRQKPVPWPRIHSRQLLDCKEIHHLPRTGTGDPHRRGSVEQYAAVRQPEHRKRQHLHSRKLRSGHEHLGQWTGHREWHWRRSLAPRIREVHVLRQEPFNPKRNGRPPLTAVAGLSKSGTRLVSLSSQIDPESGEFCSNENTACPNPPTRHPMESSALACW